MRLRSAGELVVNVSAWPCWMNEELVNVSKLIRSVRSISRSVSTTERSVSGLYPPSPPPPSESTHPRQRRWCIVGRYATLTRRFASASPRGRGEFVIVLPHQPVGVADERGAPVRIDLLVLQVQRQRFDRPGALDR